MAIAKRPGHPGRFFAYGRGGAGLWIRRKLLAFLKDVLPGIGGCAFFFSKGRISAIFPSKMLSKCSKIGEFTDINRKEEELNKEFTRETHGKCDNIQIF